jgi:hypothetical protein
MTPLRSDAMQRYSLRFSTQFNEPLSSDQRGRILRALWMLHGDGSVPPGIEWSEDGNCADVIIGGLFPDDLDPSLVAEQVERVLRIALCEPDDALVRYELALAATPIALGYWPEFWPSEDEVAP